MKVIFIGGESIGFHVLQALLEMQEIEIRAVFAERKQHFINVSALGMAPNHYMNLGILAHKHRIAYYEFDKVNSIDTIGLMAQLKPDLILVAGFSQIIKSEILSLPSKGVVGFHPSLLPERRGCAPINWAIIDGLDLTGMTMFYYALEADAGDIIAQREIKILPVDTCATLLDKVSKVAVDLLHFYLPQIAQGTAPRIPQECSRASYTPRRYPSDGGIDWAKTNKSIYNLIRGVTHPFPGAFAKWQHKILMIWQAQILSSDICFALDKDHVPGQVLQIVPKLGVQVQTGEGSIWLMRLSLGNNAAEKDAYVFAIDENWDCNTILAGGVNGKSKSSCNSNPSGR